MEILIAVSVTLFIAAFIVLTIYAIQTLIQVRQTAKAVEILAKHLDAEVTKADRVTDAVSGIASGLGQAATTLASFGLGMLKTFLSRFSTEVDEGKKEEASKESQPQER